MIGLFRFALSVLASPFRSKLRLEAENALLRHQLIVLMRRPRGRVQLTNHDRWFFIQLYRWFPAILKVLTIIRPETLVRWHRAEFRRYWRWKSRPRGGRPQIEAMADVHKFPFDIALAFEAQAKSATAVPNGSESGFPRGASRVNLTH